MIAVLLLWTAVALVLGVLVGRGIHLADVAELSERADHAPQPATPPSAEPGGAGAPSAAVVERSAVLAA